jgi:hypothetical protein
MTATVEWTGLVTGVWPSSFASASTPNRTATRSLPPSAVWAACGRSWCRIPHESMEGRAELFGLRRPRES